MDKIKTIISCAFWFWIAAKTIQGLALLVKEIIEYIKSLKTEN
jgi:hypothetical protein